VHVTPVQQAAIAKANEKIKIGEDWYRERNRINHLIYRLSFRDLERLNGILYRLSEDDLRRVAAFAEGLAEWSDPDPGSSDGSKANR
jgi:hypothetical protein